MEYTKRFIPTKGTLAKIQAQPNIEGAFYVATDTGQMFLDISSSERIPLGGTGIKIHKIIDKDPTYIEELDYYTLASSFIENFSLSSLSVNDLLLGKNNDAIYCIDEINTQGEIYVKCQKITFGGGAGSSDETDYGTNRIELTKENSEYITQLTRQKNRLFSLGEDFVLPLVFDTSLTSDEAILVTCELSMNNKIYQSIVQTVSLESHSEVNPCKLNLGSVLQLGFTNITITATAPNSKPYKRYFEQWQVVNLVLGDSARFEPQIPILKQNQAKITFYCEAIGEIDKTIHVVIDGNVQVDETGKITCSNYLSYGTDTVAAHATSNRTVDVYIDKPDIHHGPHSLKAWMTASIGSTTIYSNILSYEIGIYETDHTEAFVWLIEKPDIIERYEKLLVKFCIFDPRKEKNSKYDTIICKKDNKVLTTFADVVRTDKDYLVWNIADYDADPLGKKIITNNYSIYYNTPLKNFSVQVKPSNRNLDIQYPGSLLINLEPAGRNNSETSTQRATWLLREDSSESVEFENFNWSTNGWKYDENYVNYLSISDGAKLHIPLNIPNNTIANSNQYTFEFRGKIKNIKNYKTLVHNMTKYHFISRGSDSGTIFASDKYYTLDEVNKLVADVITTNDYSTNLQNYKTYVDKTAETIPTKIFDVTRDTVQQSWKTYYIQNISGENTYFVKATSTELENFEDNPSNFYELIVKLYDEKDIEVDKTYDLPITQVTQTVEKDLENFFISCFDDEKSTGFGLGTQETYFYNGATYLSAKYKEDEMVTVSYVVNKKEKVNNVDQYRILIYINGLLTGIVINKQNSFSIGPEILISSECCDFDLYALRVYEIALDAGAIVYNRLHDLLDLEAYDQNQLADNISNTEGLIQLDFTKVEAYNQHIFNFNESYRHLYNHPELLTMPYMVIKTVDNFSGKYTTDNADYAVNSKHADIVSTASIIDNRLPYEKDTNVRLVKATFVNPYLDYMLEKGKIVEKLNSDNPLDIIDFYSSHCPSFEVYGADLEVQGTSSQAYPRRNFKLKLKDNDYWIFSNPTLQQYLTQASLSNTISTKPTKAKYHDLTKGITWRMDHDNPYIGISKFTLKIDYMESSGSYNIGFANMIDYLYDKHPLDYYNKENALSTTDSSLKNTDYTSYKNAGYRTSVQGFPIMLFHEIDGQKVFIGRYNMITDKGADEVYGFKMPVEKNTVVNKKISDIAECWEMRDNQGTYCSFIPPMPTDENVSLKDYWAYGESIVPHIEYRYNAGEDCLDAVEEFYSTKVKTKTTYADVEVEEYYDDQGNSHKLQTKAKDNPTKTQYDEDHTLYYIYDYTYTQVGQNDTYDINTHYFTFNNNTYSEIYLGEEGFQTGVTYYTQSSKKSYIKQTKDDVYNSNNIYYIKTDPYRSTEVLPVTQVESLQNFTLNDIHGWTKKYYDNLFNLMKWMNDVNPNRAKPTEHLKDENNNNITKILSYNKEFRYVDGYVKEPYTGEGAGNTRKYYVYKDIFSDADIPVFMDENQNNFIFEITLTPGDVTSYSLNGNTIYLKLESAEGEFVSYNLFKCSNADGVNKVQITFDALIDIDGSDNKKLIIDRRKPVDRNAPEDEDGFVNGEQVYIESINISQTFEYDTPEYRKALFRKEFTEHWNLDYCLIYFIMTELLLCYDSRGKNLMIASWGPMHGGGEYIWFPIFYDIDTQLGINNSGIPTWDYDTNASLDLRDPSEMVFSTSTSVLWILFAEQFADEIANKYRQLRSANRKTTELTPTFVENMYRYKFDEEEETLYSSKGVRPLLMLNADAEYKYIKTTKTATQPNGSNTNWYYNSLNDYGYIDTNGNLVSDTSGMFFYMAQGDRDLSRQLLLRNRFNYLDSYWQAGAYKATSKGNVVVQMRMTANKTTETSDKIYFLDTGAANTGMNRAFNKINGATAAEGNRWGDILYNSIEEFNMPGEYQSYLDLTNENDKRKILLDANPHFEITPFLSQYVSVKYDEVLTKPVKSENKKTILIKGPESIQKSFLSQPGLQQQLFYIPGASYLSSFGDLSLKYLDEFFLNSAVRITELKLGNFSVDYKNPFLGRVTGSLELSDGANDLNKKFLLEDIELSGLTNLKDTIDVSGSLKLKTFRALRTKLEEVIFGENLPIHTIYLPKTIKSFKLNSCVNINQFLTYNETETIYTNPRRGLYFEDGFTDYLTQLELINDHLGYGSYDMLYGEKGILATSNSTFKKLRITNINWTPFKKVYDIKETLDKNNNYYEKTIFNTFIPIAQDKITDEKIIDGFIYVQNLENLNHIIDISNISSLLNNRSLKDTKNDTLPQYLEGEVFINNSSPIDQTDIQTLELKNSLKIYANKVNSCRILMFKYSSDNNPTIFYGNTNGLYKAEFGSGAINPVNSDIWGDRILTCPSQMNYDFIGWKIYKMTAAGPRLQTTTDLNYLQTVNRGKDEFGEDKEFKNIYVYDPDDINQIFKDPTEDIEESSTDVIYIYEAVFDITTYKAEFYIVQTDELGNILYDERGDIIKDSVYTDYKPYSYSSNPFVAPSEIPLKQYNKNNFKGSYKFMGWVRGDPTATDIENFATAYPTTNKDYYAYFKEVENGTEEALINYTTPDGEIDESNFKFDGKFLICQNPGYSGKVTFPIFNPLESNVRIEKIVGLRETKITHVFWYNNSPMESTTLPLITFDLQQAKNTLYNGASPTNKTLEYCEIPPNTVAIGDYSFYQCFNITKIDIPYTVTSLGKLCFAQLQGSLTPKIDLTIGEDVPGHGVTTFLFTGDDYNPLYQTWLKTYAIYYDKQNTALEQQYASVAGLGAIFVLNDSVSYVKQQIRPETFIEKGV